MGVELDMVLDNIQHQINIYRNRMVELETDDYDGEIEKYSFYIQCLEKLYKDLVYPSTLRKQHVLEDLFECNNNDGWDTKIIFKDESVMTIKYDELVRVTDGFIVFYDKEEYENDTTILPSIIRVVAIDEIREVYREE